MSKLPHIPFHVMPVIGTEIATLADAFQRGKLCGDGYYSQQCETWFRQHYQFPLALLTTSCTDALEMSALLANIKEGDEIIAPSYTFVSTVNAFALRGATIRFADSLPHHPNIDLDSAESLITSRTRALVVVHYAGMACDMAKAKALCEKYGLYLIEDAAQGLDAYYIDESLTKHPLGSIGDYGALSFHETKNVMAGEGGLIVVNRKEDRDRAEIIRQKGTNRSLFLKGQVDKYGWVDIGSSFLPSELNAAVLWAQLQAIRETQSHRLALWNQYFDGLASLEADGKLQRPNCPDFAQHNAHIFYLIAPSKQKRIEWTQSLEARGISTTGHYPSLHSSPYYKNRHDGRTLQHSDRYADCLLRLPLYWSLDSASVTRIIQALHDIV